MYLTYSLTEEILLVGYIGSHTVDQALREGLRVRAAVRSQAKSDVVKSYFDKLYPGKIECIIVEDMAKNDAYIDAIKGA